MKKNVSKYALMAFVCSLVDLILTILVLFFIKTNDVMSVIKFIIFALSIIFIVKAFKDIKSNNLDGKKYAILALLFVLVPRVILYLITLIVMIFDIKI